MLRRLLVLLVATVLVLPASAGANLSGGRPLGSGLLYAGTAPGVNFGGHSLPRALYMDALQVGYVMPNGLDFSYALTGMNWFPDRNDYAISMNRFAIGWRPFLEDPLPMIQPYIKAGGGFGGEGLYVCEPRVDCDPTRNDCSDTCGRANWVGSFFVGGGVDITSRLFDIGNQQLLFYVGADLRFETVGTRYQMGVVSFPIGLKLL